MAVPSIPPLAPVPPSAIRLSLGPQEWQACLDAWLTIVELALNQPFERAHLSESTTPFLISYYHELGALVPSDESFRNPKAQVLQRSSFRLASKLLLSTTGGPLESWQFLADLCKAHIRSTALSRLMNALWMRNSPSMEAQLRAQKATLIHTLEKSHSEPAPQKLTELAALTRASPDIAAYFMTGTDFIDAMVSAYSKSNSKQLQMQLGVLTCIGLLSLTQTQSRNLSLLSDHLSSLKVQAGNGPSLVAEVVTNTPMIARLKGTLSGKAADRLFRLLDDIEQFKTTQVARPRPHKNRRSIQRASDRADASDELRVHQLSLVTQIQDLFPHLGAKFVIRLLNEYNDDVEQVTGHLLEDTLPSHLRDLDRSETAAVFDSSRQAAVDHLAPSSTPPETFISERKNVFDDDELDRLEFDTSRLHVGKRTRQLSSQPSNKAAVLSALAAFDSDDDERDDTYDVDDVGGTVDVTAPDGEPGPAARVAQEENEMALFTTYKSNPELFGRTFDVRRGQARASLKAETGMTDEAIEGWAIMLKRDPKRMNRLEGKFGEGAFRGQQNIIERTSYREPSGATETEDSEAPGSGAEGRSSLRGKGRGRGGRRGGRGGGDVAGPSGDASTANAQRQKESNKGSRANHNRRDQRAKKMAKGGFHG